MADLSVSCFVRESGCGGRLPSVTQNASGRGAASGCPSRVSCKRVVVVGTPLRHSKCEWEGCWASVSRFVQESGGSGQGLPSVTQNASGRGAASGRPSRVSCESGGGGG